MPLILVTPDTEHKGPELGDVSSSLSEFYQRVLMEAGAVPVTMPATTSKEIIAECVHRCDGILLSGGYDIDPELYTHKPSRSLRATVTVTPDGGKRDYRELLLLDEVFTQKKPLLGICRGHQLLNVALGGTLIVDIRREKADALNHQHDATPLKVTHDVRLTEDSLLSKITGRVNLGVNSTHHQAIGEIAVPLMAVAASCDGIVEGLELRPETAHWLPFLLTVQFHPERLAERHSEHRSIFSAFVKACARNGK